MAKAPVKSRAARKRTATKIARVAATREQKKAIPIKTNLKKTPLKKTTPRKSSLGQAHDGRFNADDSPYSFS